MYLHFLMINQWERRKILVFFLFFETFEMGIRRPGRKKYGIQIDFKKFPNFHAWLWIGKITKIKWDYFELERNPLTSKKS